MVLGLEGLAICLHRVSDLGLESRAWVGKDSAALSFWPSLPAPSAEAPPTVPTSSLVVPSPSGLGAPGCPCPRALPTLDGLWEKVLEIQAYHAVSFLTSAAPNVPGEFMAVFS